jgi:hypothetical protein
VQVILQLYRNSPADAPAEALEPPSPVEPVLPARLRYFVPTGPAETLSTVSAVAFVNVAVSLMSVLTFFVAKCR